MQFSATHTYKHPADAVFAALTDFECIREKYEALGQTDVVLVRRDESDDGAITIATRRVVPLQLPGFAKRFLSPKQAVVQTDEWSAPQPAGTRTGTFTVEAKGTPVKISGTMRLQPAGAHACKDTTNVTIECKVPFIGGKLADFVSGDARRAVEHEHTWISGHLASSSRRRVGGSA